MGRGLAQARREENAAQPMVWCPSCRASYRKPKYETPCFCLRCGASFDLLGRPFKPELESLT